mmetsp:Transcript_20965/g.32848  ORF Transcript_20965/g.32848 Transcript_20965/m.32848 type:complete len:252 (+) Transcript_20965:628-1383(+)
MSTSPRITYRLPILFLLLLLLLLLILLLFPFPLSLRSLLCDDWTYNCILPFPVLLLLRSLLCEDWTYNFILPFPVLLLLLLLAVMLYVLQSSFLPLLLLLLLFLLFRRFVAALVCFCFGPSFRSTLRHDIITDGKRHGIPKQFHRLLFISMLTPKQFRHLLSISTEHRITLNSFAIPTLQRNACTIAKLSIILHPCWLQESTLRNIEILSTWSLKTTLHRIIMHPCWRETDGSVLMIARNIEIGTLSSWFL